MGTFSMLTDKNNSVTKMIFSQQIKNNAVYYCFLKGVVYIIQTIPQSYGHYVLVRYRISSFLRTNYFLIPVQSTSSPFCHLSISLSCPSCPSSPSIQLGPGSFITKSRRNRTKLTNSELNWRANPTSVSYSSAAPNCWWSALKRWRKNWTRKLCREEHISMRRRRISNFNSRKLNG